MLVSIIGCTGNYIIFVLYNYKSSRRYVLLVFFFLMIRPPPKSTLFPYTTHFRSGNPPAAASVARLVQIGGRHHAMADRKPRDCRRIMQRELAHQIRAMFLDCFDTDAERRSEEHTSELQSQSNLVCRLLLD